MTKRLTISVPDDVADRVGTEANASRYFTDLARADIYRETGLRQLTEAGFAITEAGVARWRGKLAQAQARRAG